MLEFEEIIEHAVTTHYTQILVMESDIGDGVDSSETDWCPFTPK